MTDLAIARRTERREWPMTSHAQRRLADEVAELRRDALMLVGGTSDDDVIRLPATQVARRLETLSAVLDGAVVVDDPGTVAIGRRATLLDQQGRTTTYAVVYPGEGDPSLGWVSADSPLGSAILGTRAGQTVVVAAPSGSWTATVVALD